MARIPQSVFMASRKSVQGVDRQLLVAPFARANTDANTGPHILGLK